MTPDGKPDKQKIVLLLHVAHKKAIDVFNTFGLTEDQCPVARHAPKLGGKITPISLDVI